MAKKLSGYDVIVYHAAAGKIHRASVRLQEDTKKDLLELSKVITGFKLTELIWTDEEGKLHQFHCNGEISYAVVPSSTEDK